MGIFSGSSSSSSATCPATPTSGPVGPIAGSLTFQKLAEYISVAAFAFTAIVMVGLILSHLATYTVPKEQRQIIRVVFTPVVFSFFSFLMILKYMPAAQYLQPIRDMYEAFSLVAIFLMFVNHVVPNAADRVEFFSKLNLKSNKGQATNSGALGWFKRIWLFVVQFAVTLPILMILQIIFEATGSYCATSNKPHFAHIWIKALSLIVTVLALLSILRFEKQLKPQLRGINPLAKLIALKLIIFLNLIQTIIFSFLTSGDELTPSSKLSYNDLTIGIPSLLLAVEQVLFAIAYIFIFSPKPYRYRAVQVDSTLAAENGVTPTRGKMNFLHAIIDASNPSDLLSAVAYAITILTRKRGTTQNGRSVRGEYGNTYVNAPPLATQGFGMQESGHAPRT